MPTPQAMPPSTSDPRSPRPTHRPGPPARRRARPNLSAARASEHWIRDLPARLRRRHLLRLHVFLIALLMLGALMLGGAGLRALGVEHLAWRYALLLPATYFIYLGLLRLWARSLLRGEDPPLDAAPDAVDAASGLMDLLPSRTGSVPFRAGGGGDFGGGGASGDFSTASSTPLSTDLPTGFSTASPVDLSPAGDALGSVGDAAGALDEGAVFLVPVIVILALGSVIGFCVFGLFGVEVLLAVSVEVALASVAGGLAWRRLRGDGWWRCAIRRTWGAALSLLIAGVLLGAAVDHWIPAADSLPGAWQLIRLK